MSNQIVLPRVLQIGKHASRKLPEVLAGLGYARPLIITDKMMVKLGYVGELCTLLEDAGINADVYADTMPEPTAQSIAAGVELARSGDYDCLVAIGGGSPIDSAKAIGVLAKHGGCIADYKMPRVMDEIGLPLVAIPTTAGTGSEATRFTVITDEQTDEKMLCMGQGFMPIAALVDYTLTLSCPPRTTADTAIDALTHAIEAYVSRKANAFSDSQALAAMRLIAPNLRTVYRAGSNETARADVMMGATLAGIAFSAASVALVHGMSRPIGAFFHVPHGLSNAMLLAIVTEYSIPASQQRYARCAVAMGVALHVDSQDVANQKMMAELRALQADLEVPTLAEYGADRARFEAVKQTMAEQALASGSPSNNPRIPSAADMVEMYDSLWA